MERFKAAVAFGNHHTGWIIAPGKVAYQLVIQVGHVAGDGEDGRGGAVEEPGMDAGQRPHAGEDISHRAAGEKPVLLRCVGNNDDLGEDRRQLAMDRLDETPSPVREEGLVAPHTAGGATGEDDAGDVGTLGPKVAEMHDDPV